MSKKNVDALLFVGLFLLPWQTRFIAAEPLLEGGAWEYGKIALYATEILLAVAFMARAWPALTLSGRVASLRLGVFLGAAFLSVGASAALPVSLAAVMHLTFALVLFIALSDVRVDVRRAAAAFCLGLVPCVLLGAYQVATGESPAASWLGLASHAAAEPGASVVAEGGARLLRAYGSFPHPNIFGGYLVVGLVLAYVLARDAATPKARALWTLVLAVLASGLALTFSRSAWIGAAAALCVFAVQAGRAHTLHAFARLTVLPVLAAILLLSLFSGALATRVSADAPLEARSVSERLTGYREFLALVPARPLFGHGLGASTAALAQAHPGRPSWAYQPPHNAPLLLLVETGLLGLIAAAWWLASAARPLGGTLTPERLALLAALAPPALLDHYLAGGWFGFALLTLSLAFMLRMPNAEDMEDIELGKISDERLRDTSHPYISHEEAWKETGEQG